MSLADIVKHFRGDFLNGSRTEALIPGPNHSPDDRSVSLKVDDDGRLIVNSWGRSDWKEAKDMIRKAGFIGFDGRPAPRCRSMRPQRRCWWRKVCGRRCPPRNSSACRRRRRSRPTT